MHPLVLSLSSFRLSTMHPTVVVSAPAIGLGPHRRAVLVTYYSFIVLGGHIGLPLVIATEILGRGPRRHPAFLNIFIFLVLLCYFLAFALVFRRRSLRTTSSRFQSVPCAGCIDMRRDHLGWRFQRSAIDPTMARIQGQQVGKGLSTCNDFATFTSMDVLSGTFRCRHSYGSPRPVTCLSAMDFLLHSFFPWPDKNCFRVNTIISIDYVLL